MLEGFVGANYADWARRASFYSYKQCLVGEEAMTTTTEILESLLQT